jgi:hypothetical protein
MAVRDKIEYRITMLVNGIEHALAQYNDDNGYGLACCGQKIGPWDIGPREEHVNCVACLQAIRTKEDTHQSSER